MKTGDLVRFKSIGAGRHDIPKYADDGKWRLGLLIEYETWEKLATVLYMGALHRVQSQNIQKEGKKDESR